MVRPHSKWTPVRSTNAVVNKFLPTTLPLKRAKSVQELAINSKIPVLVHCLADVDHRDSFELLSDDSGFNSPESGSDFVDGIDKQSSVC